MGQGNIHGSVTLTLRDQLAAKWYAMRHVIVIVALIIAVMNVFDIPVPHSRDDVAIAVLTLLSTVLVFTVSYFVLVFIVLALLSLRLSSQQRAISFEIGGESIITRDETGAAIILPWTIIRKVVEGRRSVRIRTRPFGFRYLEKRAFSESDMTAFRALLKQKLGAKAKLRKA